MKTKWKDQRGLSSREGSIQSCAVAACKKKNYNFYWQPDEGRWSGISFRNQTTITDKTAQGAATLSAKFRGLPDRSEVVRCLRFWWKFRYQLNLVQFFLSLSVTFTSMIPREASHPRSELIFFFEIHIAREMYVNVHGRCLVSVRCFPSLSRSIHFAWTTRPETLWPRGIMRPRD